ncbi:MAG: hypothetical protein KAT68_08045 [Bacteroidales bacterium]|nr:hypothetical protein [Bacteroidales bacterium]
MALKETLQAKREKANKIVSEILRQSKVIEDNVVKSKELVKSIVINTNDSKKLKSSLNRINSTTNDAILKFREERDLVSKLLTQVNNFYTKKYLPLSNKIEDKEIGFKAKIIATNRAKNEILKLKQLSIEQYSEVKNYANELKKKNRELIFIDNAIRKLLQDTTTKNQKVNELSKSIIAFENQIKKAHYGIDKLFISGQEKVKKISNLLAESNNELKLTQKIKEDGSALLKEIQDIYEIAAETGLSGEFDKRRRHLKELLSKWEKRIFITTLVLLGIIILMFVGQLWLYEWDLTNHTFDINFYIRFLIASPVVYYLYFCSIQYSQTKKLHDKYSFKTTLAMSIKHHIQLLTQHEKFDKDDRINKILDFVLDGFQRIYTEPHTDDDYKLKLKLVNMEMDIEKKIMDAISKTVGIRNDKKN